MFFEVGNCRCGQGERRWDDRSGAQNEVSIGVCTSLALRGREGGKGLPAWRGIVGGCVFLVAVVQGWDAWRWVRFCDVGVFWPRGVFSVGRFTRLGCVVPGASWGRPDGICAPVQAKFQKLSRKPSKGSLCGAVSACELRWQSGVKVEVFIVGGDL